MLFQVLEMNFLPVHLLEDCMDWEIFILINLLVFVKIYNCDTITFICFFSLRIFLFCASYTTGTEFEAG